MTRILFLCKTNSSRSQMAEGFVRARKMEGVEVLSAGAAATQVHPLAVRVMAEAGVDISGQKTKSIEDLGTPGFDIAITMCDQPAEECFIPGHPVPVHWNIPDPELQGIPEDELVGVFREIRDMIRKLVREFFDRGYFAALREESQRTNIILENLLDGIIAHDLGRRIFYFNKAAEDITGYKAAEALSRDCHDVFPGNLCGGKCAFCDENETAPPLGRIQVQIVTKSGESKFVEMNRTEMVNAEGGKVGALVSFRDLTHEHELARRMKQVQQFSGIIGRDKRMQEIYDLIEQVAESNVPVLIQGDSGTGKELVAAAIHNEGPRASNMFVPVNCGALPEGLLESELFGHVRGAFTGAIRDKKGRFELANGGTIFLDEIGDISPAMQVKLMRVLQDGTFERVGGENTLKVDARIISATNKDLRKEIAEGRFREDLYYRLNVVPIFLPPLRERRNDIPLLVEHILKGLREESHREDIRVSPEALDVIMSHDWPGNVRELQNWLQFALVKCRGPLIRPEHLPPWRASAVAGESSSKRHKLDMDLVNDALKKTGGNKVEAARFLGVSRATLYRFLDEAGHKD